MAWTKRTSPTAVTADGDTTTIPSEDTGTFTDPQTGEVTTEKKCSHCGYVKPLIAFYRKSRGRYGRQEWCKRCTNGKNPLTWEDEQQLLAQEQGTDTEVGDTLAMGAATTAADTTDTDTTTDIGVVDGIEPLTVATDDYVMTPPSSSGSLPAGQIEFGDWLKHTTTPVFGNVLLHVQRNSDDTYQVYVNQVVQIPAYISLDGPIDARYIELVVRALADNITNVFKVYGFEYR